MNSENTSNNTQAQALNKTDVSSSLSSQEKWFQYVLENKKYWTNGMTKKRLEKVKDFVFSDKDIMWDLLTRHGADKLEPKQMEKENLQMYEHCIGNFVCNIHYIMMDKKLIKG